MGAQEWSVPIIASADFRQKLQESKSFADAFFLVEYRRVRTIYRRTGNPYLGYICGKGVADLGHSIQIRGCVGLGLLSLALAEMLIASGASSADLHAAQKHLMAGRDQLETSPHNDLVLHALGEWYMLLSVTYKARGKLSEYESLLRRGVTDAWLSDHGTLGDRIPVIRQQVMMRQDLNEHIALILDAPKYKSERPLEYYRTLKRGMEFLTNSGMVASASALEREFIAAFGRIKRGIPLIAHISFAKNLAHIRALRGERQEALRALGASLGRAEAAGLSGQVKQLGALQHAIEQDEVKGALKTFRV